MSKRDQIISQRAVEGMIAEGQVIIVYNGRVMNLDRWIEQHPGGKLPLLHMVGHDASNEIAAYHSAGTLKRMSAYCIGRTEGQWKNFTPPIRGGTFRRLERTDAASVEDVGEAKGQEEGVIPIRLDSALSVEEEGICKREDNGANGVSSDAHEYSASTPDADPTLPQKADRNNHISFAVQAEIDDCRSKFPSLDPITQQSINSKYHVLHQRVHDEGFYTCHYYNYAKESIRYGFLFASFLTLLHYGWYLTSALFLGAFWQQIMFSAHDAGHRGITGRFIPDTMIGIFIADLCCGLSIGWWKSSHNVHHLVTNSPEHDPDIQNTPLFAMCPSQFSDTRSTYYDFVFVWDKACEALVPYQKYAYYPIMAIARFNLYLLSWCHLLSPRSRPLGAAAWTRPAEVIAMCGYWYLFGYVLLWSTLPNWPTRIAFVLVSHMSSMLLHVQITLSHWGMPTCDLGSEECFAQRQLRTTMDVICPIWLDWIHGGLQFQAVHHLFPRVPRHNLRKLQPLVQEFCNDTGIKYSHYGFVESNTHVLSRLKDISNQLAMLGQCQEHMALTGESGLH